MIHSSLLYGKYTVEYRVDSESIYDLAILFSNKYYLPHNTLNEILRQNNLARDEILEPGMIIKYTHREKFTPSCTSLKNTS